MDAEGQFRQPVGECNGCRQVASRSEDDDVIRLQRPASADQAGKLAIWRGDTASVGKAKRSRGLNSTCLEQGANLHAIRFIPNQGDALRFDLTLPDPRVKPPVDNRPFGGDRDAYTDKLNNEGKPRVILANLEQENS